MEMVNFSAAETDLFKKALTFINAKEMGRVLTNTLIVKTENFEDECAQLAPYYAHLGLENGTARLVFHPGKDCGHKILVNEATLSGDSCLHTLVTHMVHLANLEAYNAAYGNVYRFSQEQGINHYYYEFLLWTKFQAMKISTRVHALLSWHTINGDDPPEGNCYQFIEVNFHNKGVIASLDVLQGAGTIGDWREGLWDLLEELAHYLGGLAFYQQVACPQELDTSFPAAAIERQVGLDHCLALYGALLRAGEYGQWQEQKANIRRAIVAMQEHGRRLYEPGV